MAFLRHCPGSGLFPLLAALGFMAASISTVPAPAQAGGFWTKYSDEAAQGTMPTSCNNAQFKADQLAFAQGFQLGRHARREHADKPEHICGTVTKVLRARKSKSGWHGYFLMTTGEGKTIRIVSNLDEMQAPSWPWVQVGDNVEVQGRYYYDSPQHQGIDWTHHGTGRKWPWPGFVAVSGQKYD